MIKGPRWPITFRMFASFWLLMIGSLALAILVPRFIDSDPLPLPEQVAYDAAGMINVSLNGIPSWAHRSFNKQVQPVVNRHSLVNDAIGGLATPGGGNLWLYDVQAHQFLNEQQQYPDMLPNALRQFATHTLLSGRPMMQHYKENWWIGPFAERFLDRDVLVYMIPPEEMRFTLWRHLIGRQASWYVIGFVLFSALLAWLLARPLTSPILQLQRIATLIANGNYQARPKARLCARRDELGKLARSIRTMAHAVDNTISTQRRLLGDISHELRSPMARASLAIDLIRRKQGDSDELARVRHELTQLNELVGVLLQLARLEGSEFEQRQQVEIASWLQPLIQSMEFEAQANGKQFLITGELSGALEIEAEWFRRALENIIRNAIRYGGDFIQLTVHQTPQQITFVCEDNGEGVEEALLERLFEPFFRADEARGHKGGAGLGLAIVKRVVDIHHGQVYAARAPELGGLAIHIELPVGPFATSE